MKTERMHCIVCDDNVSINFYSAPSKSFMWIFIVLKYNIKHIVITLDETDNKVV